MIEEIDSVRSGVGQGLARGRQYGHGISARSRDFNRYLIERAPSTLDEKGESVVPEKITADHVRGYLARVMKHASRATVQRRLFAIKAYFRWRTATMDVENPVRTMRSIKVEKRLPQVVGEKDAARLVEAEATLQGPAALRDRAILEVLYSSGLRVSELTGLVLARYR